jgi:hypothetical protein
MQPASHIEHPGEFRQGDLWRDQGQGALQISVQRIKEMWVKLGG